MSKIKEIKEAVQRIKDFAQKELGEIKSKYSAECLRGMAWAANSILNEIEEEKETDTWCEMCGEVSINPICSNCSVLGE